MVDADHAHIEAFVLAGEEKYSVENDGREGVDVLRDIPESRLAAEDPSQIFA
jgi:hypothetical protein